MKRILLIATLMISIPLFLGISHLRAQDQPPQAPGQGQPSQMQDQPPQAQDQSQPQQGVGRVSFAHGDVSTMRGDNGEWMATTVNAPLVQGDSIATAQGARAEVQLDYANILRLAQSSEAKIADLERGRIQIQVASGLVDLTVLKGTQTDVEIDTPNMAVHPNGEGSYRILVNSPTDTQVTVRGGEAEVATQQGNTTVGDGQVIYVKGSDNPEYKVDRIAGSDEFDQWNRERDHHVEEAKSYQYTNRYYTGAEDLDQSGNWENVPDYGWCWTPAVDAGWVPYSDGRWVFEPYYGWTWVSYEPWGWAPYHYGRWLYYGSSWRWWPGHVTPFYRPIWAPAYVSFFGFGGRGGGFGFGFNSIGWLPLGPLDVFHPWWGGHNSYNVVNIATINNINGHVLPGHRIFGSNLQGALVDTNIRRGITTVSAGNFVQGHLPRNRTPIDVNTLRNAGVVRGTLPVVPTRQSLRPIDRPVNRGALPRTGTDRFFTSHATPAAPMPFSQRASEIQHMVQTQNPLAAGNREGARVTTGVANEGRGMTPRPAAQASATQSGDRVSWQRFGTPRQPAPGTPLSTFQNQQGRGRNWPPAFNAPGRTYPAPSRVQPSQPNNDAGWRRFNSQPRPAGNPAQRPGGWNAPAPRGYQSAPRSGYERQPLQLRRPIVREPSYSARPYGGGGGRSASAPSGGNRSYSAPARPSGGGSHSAPAPHGGGGGGHRH